MPFFKPIPDAAFLHSRYSYDQISGVLTSKYGRYAGKPITHIGPQGYITVRIHGTHFKAHRIIWKMMTGQDPPEEIDHENTDRADNCWANLRDASRANNQWNRPRQKSTRSKLKGICWNNRNQLWSSEIAVHNTRIWLGYFSTEQEAHDAYMAAARLHHGKFAR